MTNGSIVTLVDTNVLVYSEDSSEPAKRIQAVRVLERLTRANNAAVSVQVLNEFYSTTTKPKRNRPPRLTAEQAQSLCHGFLTSWTVFPLTPEATREAMRCSGEHGLAYWDALIWATAKLNSISFVLTEDMQDGRLIEGVRILNPLLPDFDLSRLD